MDEDGADEKKTGKEPKDSLDLKELCRVWGALEADVLKSFLEGHGISCLVRGRMAPFVYPMTVDGLAEFIIFVREADLETARELLASRPAPEDPGGTGGAE